MPLSNPLPPAPNWQQNIPGQLGGNPPFVPAGPGQAAGAVGGAALGLTGDVVAFVFSAIGNFITNFSTTLLQGVGRANQGYIVGLLVAAVVLFVLLGGS